MMVRLLPLAAALVSFVLFTPAASALIIDQCETNADCDDELYCTVEEVCDPVLGCLPGGIRDCGDGFFCTIDLCDELADTCVHTPNDLLCTDGNFCNGAETCSGLLGCQDAPAPCDDGVDCTDDTCNELTDLCLNVPDSEQCSEGSLCTPLGCTPPLTCDEDADCEDGLYCTINECDDVLGCLVPQPRLCLDDIVCTVDVCDELADTCTHTPVDLLCADANFCDGTEVCDGLLGCQEGEASCSDGVGCTTDECNEALDICTHTPDSEQCPDESICTPLGCTPDLACESDEECDDGVGCTVDTCDDLLDVCIHVPSQALCADEDPCTLDLCAPILDCQHLALPDLDFDGSCDLLDNCPLEANPDQANSDCPDPDFAASGGCLELGFDSLNDPRRGCCDGGDVCDICPARVVGTNGVEACNAARSGGINCPAETGCTLETFDGCVRIEVPAGALDEDRSISVTDHIDQEQNLLHRDAFLYRLSLRPESIAPSAAIAVSVCWEDRDDDDLADEGTCAGNIANIDLGLTCDHDQDCTAGFCSRRSTTPEGNLLLKRNSEPFSGAGAFAGAFACGDHDEDQSQENQCHLATADCTAQGADTRTLAGCCDMEDNRWHLSTCRFSELVFGEFAGDLPSGSGTRLTDCVTEWNIVNPHNDPLRDAAGLPAIEQVCRDGDPLCDADGQADGTCTFSVGVCFNVTDRRMTDANANRLCAPTSITEWRVDGGGADIGTIRNAVATLGGGDADAAGVSFDPAFDASNACTRLVPMTVDIENDAATTRVLRMSGATTYSTDDPALLATTTTLPVEDPLCGNLDDDGQVDATDALLTLRTAVRLQECDTVLCDVDADARVTATDALGVLNTAVENEIELTCGLGPLPSDRDRLRLTCQPALQPVVP